MQRFCTADFNLFLLNGVKFSRRMKQIKSITACYENKTISTETANYISVTIDPECDATPGEAQQQKLRAVYELPGSVAVIKMQKTPVNALCSNYARQLINAINDLENNENVRAVIITSALPDIFCAGLDVKPWLGATYDDIFTLWKDPQDLVLKLYGSRLITIAVINGHCVGAGTIIPLTADYRIMAEGGLYKIGLNETKTGLFVPFYLRKMMENLIGTKATARALQLGTLFPSAEAYKVGLVDEVVPLDQVMSAARKELKQWLDIPDSGRELMKSETRKTEIQKLIDGRTEDAHTWARLITSPDFQKVLRASLNNKKKK